MKIEWMLACVMFLGCNDKAATPVQECAPCLECQECPTAAAQGSSGEGFHCQAITTNKDADWNTFCHRSKEQCFRAGPDKAGIVGACKAQELAWCFIPKSGGVNCSLEKTTCVRNWNIWSESGNTQSECELTY